MKLPEMDDLREVIQEIMFGERQSVMGKKVMDVVSSLKYRS